MRKLRIALSLLMASALLLVGANPANAAVWSSTAQWGNWTSGAYTIYNNIWGSGAGPQTIWANSTSNWGVWANHPNTGGIKSYPNASITVNKRLSALKSATSSFNVTVPTSGVAFTSAYDIWADGHTYEIMLWMNKYGAVGPLGTFQTNVTVGNHSWAVYSGSNGSNQVFSFVRTSNTSAGTVNIKAVMDWIKTRGWYGDVTLSQVQFGYEITSSSGGKDFVTNSYSATAS
ncbi:GH12 family glycosyl hydrolase domain-containing protein [Actinoplanes couchii]|uniref:Glycoside hydrolase family 12 n=1 Tax=Actinoplanes couchii TaxID=403638 RepID=A0ABQ3X7G5_9ACTN|nr:hypothetical protein [Actinoplanes couchii]MDR6322249.1 hypothetical protein [Actinoplanes couchii]GID54409.1 hypothetical protein Aco03nite_028130 [Actinoplanes couchii]